MVHCENYFAARDRLQLFEQSWRPADDEPKAVVAIIHGLIEHGGRFDALAAQLNRHGYAVHAMDLRGHGRSEGARCFVNSFDDYVDDVSRFIQRVRLREPGKPLFVLGNSMGGLIASLWAIASQPSIQGLVLCGPLLGVSADLFPRVRLLAKIANQLVPRLPLIRFDFDRLSRDPEAVANFRNDPLVHQGRIPIRTGAEILQAIQSAMSCAGSLHSPLLVLHGAEDKLCEPQGSEAFVRRAGTTDKTLRIYPGVCHSIFREPERDAIVENLISWLEDRWENGPPLGIINESTSCPPSK